MTTFVPSAQAGRTEADRIGGGTLVLVVGPSGAGKDTLIAYARERLAGEPRLVFPKRLITRRDGAGAEDHVAVSAEAFLAMLAERRFALNWHAHGLYYGIPVEIDAAIEAGSVVVANVSRSVVASAHRRYADVVTVDVHAPPAVLAERLRRRAREEAGDIEQRLSRSDALPEVARLVRIANDGPIEAAGEQLATLLRERLAATGPAPAAPASVLEEQ